MTVIKRALIGFVGVLLVLLVWGLVEPYMPATETQAAYIPGLPAAWEGQQIAVLADWQIGMWLDNTATIQQAVAELVARRPAAVLIAGILCTAPAMTRTKMCSRLNNSCGH